MKATILLLRKTCLYTKYASMEHGENTLRRRSSIKGQTPWMGREGGGIMNDLVNILLVEDDESLIRGISFKLKKEGYQVLTSASLKEARNALAAGPVDLILLDVSLPDGDGFQFCQEIRKTSDVLIIFLTTCDQEVDVIMGYDLGADDYISKPFSLLVLISKINAVLRRGRAVAMYEQLISKEIVFYRSTMKVLKRDCEIALTRTEMKLFQFFISNPQRIISKERFLSQLWDIEGDFIDENTLPVHIRRLREKIEDDPSTPQYIKTIRGAGYIWAERCSCQ